jgi:hypothetical protein
VVVLFLSFFLAPRAPGFGLARAHKAAAASAATARATQEEPRCLCFSGTPALARAALQERSLVAQRSPQVHPLSPPKRGATSQKQPDSKKLGLPGGVRLRCVAWHAAGDWVACGGENGLLKVFRFGAGIRGGEVDDGEDDESSHRRPRPSVQHQTLEGHASAVVLADFCEPFGKLATADEAGVVMVWSLRSQACSGAGQEGQRDGGEAARMLWEETAYRATTM